jgi:hypothetical protein
MLNHALMCLATTIYMESAYQPIQAQVAVGYVLMRRADFNIIHTEPLTFMTQALKIRGK